MAVFGKRTEPISPAVGNSDNNQSANVSPMPPVRENRVCENRKERRSRTIKAGKITYNDRHFTMPCAIRDISDSGARLKIDKMAVAPDTFVLIVELDAIEMDCEVVWRNNSEIGVKFTSEVRQIKRNRVQVVESSSTCSPHGIRRRHIR